MDQKFRSKNVYECCKINLTAKIAPLLKKVWYMKYILPAIAITTSIFGEMTLPEVSENESFLQHAIIEIDQNHPLDALRNLESVSIQNPEDEFIILFCRVIVYDQIGYNNLSMNCLNQLESFLVDDSFEQDPSQAGMAYREERDALQFLEKLIQFAPSESIQERLKRIISGVSFEEINGIDADDCDSHHHHRTKKFIKRWTHILKRIGQLLELLKNIKHIIDDGNEIIWENHE